MQIIFISISMEIFFLSLSYTNWYNMERKKNVKSL